MNESGGAVMPNKSLLSPAMLAVAVSQFLSAFADNALLFATLALLKSQAYPTWSYGPLQMVFVVSYIVLAPFIGQIADSYAGGKGRVMLWANNLKLLGTLITYFFNPFVGYALVGMGAALYSPAKYGILGELTDKRRLVRANSLIESSTIVAILLGAIAGGSLSDWHIVAAFVAIGTAYFAASLVNLLIPRLPPARPYGWRQNLALSKEFFSASVLLLADSRTRLSLLGTGSFWGAGVVLRLLVVLWVPVALQIEGNAMPTYLTAMVALGVAIGAVLSGRYVQLSQFQRCLPAGIALGLTITLFSLQQQLPLSFLLLLLVGCFGGFFIVPLNALLQEVGKSKVGVGSAIAVQNFIENSAMLFFLALYSLAIGLKVSVVALGIGLGLLLMLIMLSLTWRHWRRQAD